MTRVFKTLVAVVALLAVPAGALRAEGNENDTCHREGGMERPGTAGATVKPRLFERSADPTSERPGIVRAVGQLAVKASSAPLQFTRWLRTRTAQLRAGSRSD